MEYWLCRPLEKEPYIGSFDSLPGALRALIRDGRAGWLAVFPIRVAGRIWGLLQLEKHAAATEWSPVEVQALTQFCRILSQTIECRHTHQELDSTLNRNQVQRQIILDEFPDMIRFVDPELRIIWANDSMARMLADDPRDVVGRTCYDLILGADAPCNECPTLEALQSGKVVRREMQKHGVLGHERESHWEVCSIPLTNAEGNIEGFVQISRDIIEQKQTLIALRESEAALRAILEASPVGIGLNKDKRLVWDNRALGDLFGLDINESTGLSGMGMELDDAQYRRITGELKQARRSGRNHIETEWRKRGGRSTPIYLQTRWLDMSDPEKGTIIAVSDTTEQKRSADQIHFLTRELIKAQEKERARIARDLHDHLGQDLSSLKIVSETLFEPGVPVPRNIRERTEELSEMLQNAIDAVRDMAYDLRPPGLDELGLVHTVYQYCEDFQDRTGIQVDFVAAGMENLSPGHEIEINIYRTIQEAFNNIMRHSGARHVQIRLVSSSPHIILRIEDNGCGFDLEAAMLISTREKRMGLGSMRERVALMDGELKIESQVNRGTKVYAQIPYREVAREKGI